MTLNSSQKKILKRKGHTLKPKLKIGKGGFGDENIKIMNKLLSDLSLIKIRILGDKPSRLKKFEALIELNICEIVGSIGASVLLFKKNGLNLLEEKDLIEENDSVDEKLSE
ncbi:MAG: ribosome assembly RNA-binding protein YhbY [Planctomycetota bacterium]|nr:MAG: ribosome assembly RNA-binding protein YhbY [Planctomycetota bacterium]